MPFSSNSFDIRFQFKPSLFELNFQDFFIGIFFKAIVSENRIETKQIDLRKIWNSVHSDTHMVNTHRNIISSVMLTVTRVRYKAE